MKRILASIAVLLVTAAVVADDGELFLKNVSKTPSWETEHATIEMLKLYVPAQTSAGVLLDQIEYYAADGTVAFTRPTAKPLVAFYNDGPNHLVPDSGGFPGHGEMDCFGAVSLDDGATWKRTNLSNSADLSSFTLRNGTAYPGNTFRLFGTSAGNKLLVAWASRYCADGNSNYAMDDVEREALAAWLGLPAGACTDVDENGDPNPDTPCLYLEDYWGVAGSQGSSDMTEEGYPTVGELPYACLWAARGTLEPTDAEGNYDPAGEYRQVIWRKAEKLTSGTRDVHRIETATAGGAGFVITWQEDPDGIRPGEGEGPGEGWSGAVAHHQTDIWYAYIDWDHFDLVDDGDSLYGTPVTLAEYTGEGTPQVGVPFSMPVRLTDNAMCNGGGLDDPYCYADFDGNGTADLCAYDVTVDIDTPEGPDPDVNLCVTEDERLLRGNTASTRTRTNLRGYDSDGDGVNDGGWVLLAYEESKGLGEEDDFDPNDLIEKVDMGKNIWYHTFNMFTPELVSQGMMLNQPAVYPDDQPTTTGDRLEPAYVTADGVSYKFMDIDPDPIYEDQAGIETTLYQAEIARRFSLISQPASYAGDSGLVAFALFKQGIIRRGGPADIFARRFVLPDDFDPALDNPFDYANMDCGINDADNWQFTEGENPRYVKGLCVAPMINMSGYTVVECEDGSTTCADSFPWNEYFDDVDPVQQEGIPKIYQWVQTGPDYGSSIYDVPGTFFDMSWTNPFDVAKGHRGLLDGDFIMMMYGWSPNWHALTDAHDNNNLYIRRSFDGGLSWTTTPANWDGLVLPDGITVTADGTTTCEYMGPAGTSTEYQVCTIYTAGVFEQARNVSLVRGTQDTVLDPRYAPTSSVVGASIGTDADSDGTIDTYAYPDDQRDPSKFFITFEMGDNASYDEGEATPQDMYYSRAYNYGDDYELVESEDPATGELTYYFDALEKSAAHAAEAAVLENPGGTFMYAIWNQWMEDELENIWDSDAMARRIIFLDDEPVTPPSGGGKKGGGRPRLVTLGAAPVPE